MLFRSISRFDSELGNIEAGLAAAADSRPDLDAMAAAAETAMAAVTQAGEAAVAELMVVLDQSQPRVSRHLRLLCEAGVAEHFREGRWVYYYEDRWEYYDDSSGAWYFYTE